MVCETVTIDGVTAIVCSRRRRRPRCKCGTPAELLCDWKVGRKLTCDRPICREHAQEVAPDRHLCPEHQESYRRWLAERGK